MEHFLGLLRIRVGHGVNLAVRDTHSRTSDPYVIVSMGDTRLKTSVVKKNCNPEWNEELTLSIKDVKTPIGLSVYDKDTLTDHDKMGDAKIDIEPLVECLKMGYQNLPDGCVVKRVYPNITNDLADESHCIWNKGRIVQNMYLRLRNVECGEVAIQIEWIDVDGAKGLPEEGTSYF